MRQLILWKLLLPYLLHLANKRDIICNPDVDHIIEIVFKLVELRCFHGTDGFCHFLAGGQLKLLECHINCIGFFIPKLNEFARN